MLAPKRHGRREIRGLSVDVERPRDRILHALKTRGGLGASDLSEVLGTGVSAVRPHLDTLVHEGLVRVEVVRGGQGRLRHRYVLTEEGHEGFARDYDGLAESLIDGVLDFAGNDLLRRIFRRHEDRLVERYQPRMQTLGFAGRVRETARILDECGYMARLERRGDGFMLTEHNCPVSRVAAECEAPCESELSFIRRLTDADVTQVSIDPNGAGGCRYMIRERRTAEQPAPAAASS